MKSIAVVPFGDHGCHSDRGHTRLSQEALKCFCHLLLDPSNRSHKKKQNVVVTAADPALAGDHLYSQTRNGIDLYEIDPAVIDLTIIDPAILVEEHYAPNARQPTLEKSDS